MNNNKINRALERVATRIPNSIIRISARGVPHIVVDSYYSVAYFFSSDTYNVFSNYATPNNKKELHAVTFDKVIEFFKGVAR